MKKAFYLLAVVCFAFTSVLFSSCEKEVKSSYVFNYNLDQSTTLDPALVTQFELSDKGHVVIYNEMKKTADQFSDPSRSCIYKDTRDAAISRAKDGFAKGMQALREASPLFKGWVIVLTMDDPDTNKPVKVDSATI